MKTKLTLIIGAVALVTLSFTFSSVDSPKNQKHPNLTTNHVETPVGGIVSDEVVK